MTSKSKETGSLEQLQDVVTESSAQFEGLRQLYKSNANYKACEQDQNRVGLLDCEIVLADIKRKRALECPMRDESLQKFRQEMLDDALEQVDSAEKVCWWYRNAFLCLPGVCTMPYIVD